LCGKALPLLSYVGCESEPEMTSDDRDYDNDNDDDEGSKPVPLSTLSDAQLIHILQEVVDDEALAHFIEAEIARRKVQGGALQ
jgi:hypothetical protein